jgi:3-oxoacyl-[acyl-carrier-protein] synthase-1/3-oxoacyl-[acyl-carrier-protein] synthase II
MSAMGQAITELDVVRAGWRGERVAVAVGTSSGGMLSAERFFARRAARAQDAAQGAQGDHDTAGTCDVELSDLARRATYFAPLRDAMAAFDLKLPDERVTQVLAACAASTIAIGIALRWLERGACDLVLAGGYDALSVFVAAGFEALRATTASVPKPFRRGRDGMALGEGAGILALVRSEDLRGAVAKFRVAGFGASTDAVHITAPDRTGSGLARAALAALADSSWPAERIGLVSAHATATPYNDAMESRAMAAVFGANGGACAAPSMSPPERIRERPLVVHPFKAQIGHTLGAAGVLEALAASEALRTSIAPAAASDGESDPDAPARLLTRAESCDIEGALKLSAAFGGANAALVLTRHESGRVRRGLRAVHLRGFAHVESADLVALADATGVARDRLARLDTLCRLGLGAVAALAAIVGRESLKGAGIVAGHGLATLDTNEAFDARRRTRGATAVEPRLFPATSPNALGGECAIVYQCTGPGFAVGAGLDGASEALARAVELVAAGDADRMLVVAADEAGPTSRDLLAFAGWDRKLVRGAVAVLLDASPEGAQRTMALDARVNHGASPVGHLALLEWLRFGERA